MYTKSLEQWSSIAAATKPVFDVVMQMIDAEIEFKYSKEKHGFIFVGAFFKEQQLEFVSPILLAFDALGKMLDLDKYEILQAFKTIPESCFNVIEPDVHEKEVLGICFDQIAPQMTKSYLEENQPVIEQNDIKIKNWIDNLRWQYKAESDDLQMRIFNQRLQKGSFKNFQEKVDIQKRIDRLEKELVKRDEKFHDYMLEVEKQAKKDREAFNAQFVIKPTVLVNIVVKF